MSQMQTTITNVCTILIQKVLEYGNHLDEITEMTTRNLPKYSTSFRPLFKHQTPNGATDKGPSVSNKVTMKQLTVGCTS